MSRPEALRARDAWAEQVWCSTLRANDRLVALAYADHARDGLDSVFVTVERLVARTDLSRSTVLRCVARLRELGWFELVEPARQHRAPRYALRMPTPSRDEDDAVQRSQRDTPEGSHADTPGATRGVTVDARGVSRSARGVSVTPDLSPHLSPHHPVRAGGVGSTASGADPRRPDVVRAALDAGVDAGLVDRVVDLALTDTGTRTPAGRMARDAGWRERLVGRAGEQDRAVRRADSTAAERTRLRHEVARHGQAGARALTEARYAQGRPAGDESLTVLRQAIHDLAEASRAPTRAASALPTTARMRTTC